MRPLIRARHFCKWTALAFQRREAAIHVGERHARKTAASVAGVDEISIVVIIAQQDGAEMLARVAGLGVTAHHELLALLDLELEPGTRPLPGLVNGVLSLRDHAFPAVGASLLEERCRIAGERVADAQHVRHRGVQQLEQMRSPHVLRLIDQRLITIEKNVESHIGDRCITASRGDGRAVGRMHSSL